VIGADVIVFPGSNGDRDAAHAWEAVTGLPARLIWHDEWTPAVDRLAILPGGFAYGDYLRAGAVAALSPALPRLRAHLEAGGLAVGICNGFQILVEAGLLPGAFRPNADLSFRSEVVHVRVESARSPFTAGLPTGAVLALPIAHGEGNYYLVPEELGRLEAERRVAFRYCDPDGRVTPAANPNGSVGNVAGVLGYNGRLLGLMPHPERNAEPALGTADGRFVFLGALEALRRGVAV
jgi:phosphoribosylformylglycinamidine synthase I